VCLLQDSKVGGLMQRLNEAVRAGLCKYCGVPAETIFGGSSSSLGDHFNLVCMTCFGDLTEFVRRPENASLFRAGDEAALHNVAAHLADFQKRRDEFMKQRVLERKAK